MSLEDFKLYNRQNNKNLPSDPSFKPEVPSPDTIYYKDFHFLDEPLINRKYPPKPAHLLNQSLSDTASQQSSTSLPPKMVAPTLEKLPSASLPHKDQKELSPPPLFKETSTPFAQPQDSNKGVAKVVKEPSP